MMRKHEMPDKGKLKNNKQRKNCSSSLERKKITWSKFARLPPTPR